MRQTDPLETGTFSPPTTGGGRRPTTSGGRRGALRNVASLEDKKVRRFTHGQVLEGINEIRRVQKYIEERVRAVQARLKRAEGQPAEQPWIELIKRVKNVQDLRSSKTLKQALEYELLQLKTFSKLLRLEAKNLQNQNRARQVRAASADFKKRLQEACRRAEKSGALSAEELRSLLKESDEVLGKLVGLLDADPSSENIRGVLGGLEIPMLLGGEGGTAASTRAWKSLNAAGKKNHRKAEQDFRGHPTPSNGKKMLEARATMQELGGAEEFWPVGLVAAGEIKHTVKEGESLAGISKQYYGSPGYWDCIYMRNFHTIGNDPESLKIGLKLVIP